MKFRELHPNVQIRLAQNFLGNIVGSMVFPFLTIYFTEAIGPSWTGLLVILNIFANVAAGAYGGHFADKYGRKRVKVFAETSRVVFFVVITCANSPWYHSALVTGVAMLLVGFCDGLSGPASEAMLIDVTTPETRTLVYAIDYWSNNLGLVVGGIAGGYLFRSYQFELFGAMTLFLFASLLVLLFWVTETIPAHQPETALGELHEKSNSMTSAYKLVFKNRIFVVFLLGALFCGALENINNNYSRVRLNEAIYAAQTFFTVGHWVVKATGLQLFAFLQALNATIVVLFSAWVRKWVHRFGHRLALLGGVSLSLIGFGVILVNNHPLVLVLSMIVATFGEILWVPVKQTILAELAPAENRGVYMAVAGFTGIGSFMIGGLSITLGAFVTPWTMLAVFVCIGLLSLRFYQRTFAHLSPKNHSAHQKASL